MESIIQRSKVCHLALSEDNRPYVIPLNFGYKDRTLFFHSAREGKKLDMLKKNNRICFAFSIDHEVVPGETACQWSMKYQSVVGFGRATLVDDPESKQEAYDIIMNHYTGRTFSYDTSLIDRSIIIRVDIEKMTGKKS